MADSLHGYAQQELTVLTMILSFSDIFTRFYAETTSRVHK